MNQALDDAELDRLGQFLASAGETAMTLEEVDGWFCAAICGPTEPDPMQSIPQVWGEQHTFADVAEAEQITELLLRHWNAIAATLAQGLRDERTWYWPLVAEDEHGAAQGNQWALAFLRGIDAGSADWEALMADEEAAQSLIPILHLAHEHDPDPATRSDPLEPAQRAEYFEWIAVSLGEIYAWFAGSRLPPVQQVRREGPKVGRNDPCPCGSGRKYKRCCAAAGAA